MSFEGRKNRVPKKNPLLGAALAALLASGPVEAIAASPDDALLAKSPSASAPEVPGDPVQLSEKEARDTLASNLPLFYERFAARWGEHPKSTELLAAAVAKDPLAALLAYDHYASHKDAWVVAAFVIETGVVDPIFVRYWSSMHPIETGKILDESRAARESGKPGNRAKNLERALDDQAAALGVGAFFTIDNFVVNWKTFWENPLVTIALKIPDEALLPITDTAAPVVWNDYEPLMNPSMGGLPSQIKWKQYSQEKYTLNYERYAFLKSFSEEHMMRNFSAWAQAKLLVAADLAKKKMAVTPEAIRESVESLVALRHQFEDLDILKQRNVIMTYGFDTVGNVNFLDDRVAEKSLEELWKKNNDTATKFLVLRPPSRQSDLEHFPGAIFEVIRKSSDAPLSVIFAMHGSPERMSVSTDPLRPLHPAFALSSDALASAIIERTRRRIKNKTFDPKQPDVYVFSACLSGDLAQKVLDTVTKAGVPASIVIAGSESGQSLVHTHNPATNSWKNHFLRAVFSGEKAGTIGDIVRKDSDPSTEHHSSPVVLVPAPDTPQKKKTFKQISGGFSLDPVA
jgi:hypothetical protein